MGYTTNRYNAYRDASVKTASQGQLIVMLYEAAVRQLESASDMYSADGKILPNKIEGFGNCLQKVQDIIMELEVSLDMDNGGEIAKNLMALYVFFSRQISDVILTHDREKLNFVLKMLTELHGSWVIAANSNANADRMIPADRPALNITG